MATSFFLEEREALREIFPRGRFEEDEDGTCILRSSHGEEARDHVYVQKRGELLGIFYRVGSGRRYLDPLGDLVVEHLKGDGEGLIHVRWCPEAAAVLRRFSLRAVTLPGGNPENLRRVDLQDPDRPELTRGEAEQPPPPSKQD